MFLVLRWGGFRKGINSLYPPMKKIQERCCLYPPPTPSPQGGGNTADEEDTSGVLILFTSDGEYSGRVLILSVLRWGVLKRETAQKKRESKVHLPVGLRL